jgi:hypothetical protein
LLDVKNHVTKLSNYISTKKIIDEGVHTKTNMRDFFTTYIPQLAVTSFVETEHGANALSDESWQVLFGMQKISSYVWQTLEQRRADFYRAYYQELYRALQKFDAHNTFFTSIINGNEKLPQLNDCPSNKNGVSLNLHELEFYSN